MNRTLAIIWLIGLIIFAALDVIATYFILEAGGAEQNQIFNLLVEKFGPTIAILLIGSIVKAVVIIGLYFGFKYVFNWVEYDKTDTLKEKSLFKILLYFGMAAILYVFILPVIHNLNQINPYN